MHGLQTPIDITFQYHLPEYTDLGSFILRLERQVGLVPFRPHAHSLEADFLFFDSFARKRCRFLTQLDRAEALAFLWFHVLNYF